MSYKASLIKAAIKWTPKAPILWVVNFKLKGIAEITQLNFDLDARTVYIQTQLFGEPEPIDVWLDDFSIVHENESYQFILQQARSNRPWLTNLMAFITGKAWQIPNIPQLANHMVLVAELLNATNPK